MALDLISRLHIRNINFLRALRKIFIRYERQAIGLVPGNDRPDRAGNGGVDRIAAPAIAPSPARQINVSATVLITGRLLARERAQPLSLNGPRMRLWIDRKEATPRQQMLRTHPYDAAGQAYTLGPTFRAGPSTHRALREFPRKAAFSLMFFYPPAGNDRPCASDRVACR